MSKLSDEMGIALADYRVDMWEVRKKELQLEQEKERVFMDFLERCEAIHNEASSLQLWKHKRSKCHLWESVFYDEEEDD